MEETTIFGGAILISILSSVLTAIFINWKRSSSPAFKSRGNNEFNKLEKRTDELWEALITKNTFTGDQAILAATLPALRNGEKEIFSYIRANTTTEEMNEISAIILNTGISDLSESDVDETNSILIIRIIKKINHTLEEATKERRFFNKISPFFSSKNRILDNIENPPSQENA